MKKLVIVAMMVVVGASFSACKKEEKAADPKAGDVKPADKAAADKAAADKLAADKAAADKAAADKATPPAGGTSCADVAGHIADLAMADPEMAKMMATKTPDEQKAAREGIIAKFQGKCDGDPFPENVRQCVMAATDANGIKACKDAAEKAEKAAAPAAPAPATP